MFAGPIENVTVNVGREAVLECHVNNLRLYKVLATGWQFAFCKMQIAEKLLCRWAGLKLGIRLSWHCTSESSPTTSGSPSATRTAGSVQWWSALCDQLKHYLPRIKRKLDKANIVYLATFLRSGNFTCGRYRRRTGAATCARYAPPCSTLV